MINKLCELFTLKKNVLTHNKSRRWSFKIQLERY